MVSLPLPRLHLVCVLLLVYYCQDRAGRIRPSSPAFATGSAHNRPPAPRRLSPARLPRQPRQEAWPRRDAPPPRRGAGARRVVATCRRGGAAHARSCLGVAAPLHGHRHHHVRLVRRRLRALRRALEILTTHVLSAKRVQSLRIAATEEVSMVIAKINKAAEAGGTVDMSELLHSFANDMACRIVSEKFFLKKGRRKLFRDLINDSSRLLGGFNLEDYFPALARVGMLKRVVCAKAERVRNRWDDLLDKVIDDRMDKNMSSFNHKDDDFIDILLSIQQKYDLTREHMKSLLIDVFFGATDTSYNVLEFTLAELMRRPHLIGKLQDEVRSIVPLQQEIVGETDMKNMTYLRAVIKESLRLHPVAPFLAQHLAMADCSINGYMVHADTRVIINIWAICRDSTSWKDAEEFMPERFVEGGSDVHANFKGNDFQFLPFGAGRRMCPGMNLAMANVELMLANLMYHFEWQLPLGVARKDIDMTEVFGLTVQRKEKLLLIPKAHM